MLQRILPRLTASRGFVSDLGTSLFTQALVVVANLATLKCAATIMTVSDVGSFVLLRRVVVFLSPMLLLGLGVGLPRSLGRQLDNPSSGRATGLLLSGWLLGSATAVLAVCLLMAFPKLAAHALLGGAENAKLILPLAWMILGHQLFMLIYAVRRGRLEIQRANLLQAMQIALLPLFVVLWRGPDGVEAVVQTLGIAAVLSSVVASILLLVRVDIRKALGQMRSSFQELVSYGVPRVPGDLAAAGMYAIGPILVAHQLDLQAAGLLAVGMSLITVLSAAFGPIGLVLLPRLSKQLAHNREDEIRSRLPLLVGATVFVASTIAVAGGMFGNTWLSWILNDSFSFRPADLVLLMLAAGANVIFVVLRSLIDAADFRPLNAVHTTISLAVLVVVWALVSWFDPGNAFHTICLAIAAAFVTLAVLTLMRVSKRFQLGPAEVLTGIRWPNRPAANEESLEPTVSPATLCGTAGHEGCTDKSTNEGSRRAEDEVERSYR